MFKCKCNVFKHSNKSVKSISNAEGFTVCDTWHAHNMSPIAMIACVWRCVVCCGHTMLIIKQYARKVDLLEQVLECGMRLKSIKVELCATVHNCAYCAVCNCELCSCAVLVHTHHTCALLRFTALWLQLHSYMHCAFPKTIYKSGNFEMDRGAEWGTLGVHWLQKNQSMSRKSHCLSLNNQCNEM